MAKNYSYGEASGTLFNKFLITGKILSKFESNFWFIMNTFKIGFILVEVLLKFLILFYRLINNKTCTYLNHEIMD